MSETKKDIARHEAGHVLALIGSGLYDEFESASVGSGFTEGRPVNGLTIRSGKSLLDFAVQIGTVAGQGAAAYRDFMLANACKVCFPHICFFSGGEAIQSCCAMFGPTDEARLVIDHDQIRTKVLPAMGLPMLDNVEFMKICNWGVGAVKDFIMSNFDLTMGLADELLRRGKLDKFDLDAFLGGRAKEIAAGLAEHYGHWLGNMEHLYPELFRQQNSWAK